MTGWGITGIGLRSRRVCELLPPQDLLFTVAELSAAGPRFRVVGALHRYLHAPDQPLRALAELTAPSTQLVTLTLTGDGYPCDPASRGFPAEADLQHDLRDPQHPRTAFGYLVEALDRRRRAGRPGLTVLSCDNRPDSAAAARASVLALAHQRDAVLARWIEQYVCFPDSMVDRIPPPPEQSTGGWFWRAPGCWTAGRSP